MAQLPKMSVEVNVETSKDGGQFDEWAVLELFGHQKLAGRVTQATTGGGAFVRVDVPDEKGRVKFTKFLNPSAIYSIAPVEENVAVAAAQSINAEPIKRYELAQLAVTSQSRMAYGEDEDEP